MKFLLHYLLTAFVLGAVVWFGVPVVKARAAQPREGAAAQVGSAASAPATPPGASHHPPQRGGQNDEKEPPSVRGDAVTHSTTPPPSVGGDVAESTIAQPLSVREDAAEHSTTPPPSVGGDVAENTIAQPLSVREDAAEHSTTPPPSVRGDAAERQGGVSSLSEFAPGQEPRQASYDGPRYDWGILMRAAQAYTLEGTPRMELPGGTVVEKMSERRTKSGDMMLICRIRDNRRWQEGFVFHSADVVQFQGPFAFAPKQASDQIIDYFTKVDLREKRMAAIREEHLRTNPYFETYQEAARAYKEFQQRAKELTASRDAAVGAERQRLIRELEVMKSQQPRLRAEFEKAEIPYKQWKKQHGDGTDEINADPVVQKLDEEIKTLYEVVADMVPGL